MNVAVLSESSADEAAVRVLAEAVLGVETSTPPPLKLRSRGWPSVLTLLPSVIKDLHFRTDAEALIVVADSDHSIVHVNGHDEHTGGVPGCRVCELRRARDSTIQRLPTRVGRPALKVAVGVAVPAVEAWYAKGRSPHVNEIAWARALLDRKFPYTKTSLKELVYGTSRPSLALETERAVEAAMRLAMDVGALEADFPGGFGALAADLRGWS